ncbi:hypothetical protein [Sinisalibacter aestuarii]|uniref:Phospholipase A2 domain-containing protein n=1 Tax=Sinisalibacter aestuarii TaxID=2949426 RepID=A0ABQ5LVI7_9RHOB|nr:hypothetical protein [Sinisalibacter aestuarii]GKY88996.1 hypothetical protein STA1M1_28650 [Sinisalibacter aestuarii]
MIRIAAFLLAVSTAAPAVAQEMAFPVHGNWCGPYHGSGPILDALDDACFRHDFCASQNGLFNCGCDLAFMTELRERPWPNPALAEKARAVYEAIALAPCTDSEGQRSKMNLAAADWAAGVASGREPPWAILDRLGALMAEGVARSGE